MSYIGDSVPTSVVLQKTFVIIIELAVMPVGNTWLQ